MKEDCETILNYGAERMTGTILNQSILNKRRQWNHSAILTRRDDWNLPQLVYIE
jgi:hypothetical protein